MRDCGSLTELETEGLSIIAFWRLFTHEISRLRALASGWLRIGWYFAILLMSYYVIFNVITYVKAPWDLSSHF